jgi:NitT/TauT family transport system substrate-binding protein
MQSAQTRRRLLATLSSATAVSAFGGASISAQEAPPETRTIRLAKIPGVCIAPQYVAEDLLRSEGFDSVQYVELSVNTYEGFAKGTVDISMAFIAPYIIQLDTGLPLVLIGGVHAGCFELFGTDRVKAIRDLKGKTVALPELGSAHHVFVAAMASHVGIDPKRDINFVIHPPAQSMQLLADGKIDALMAFPPDSQELREKKLGQVIVSSGLDRPWSQYFCCIVAAHQEFTRKHPVATKRALRAILKATQFCAAEPEGRPLGRGQRLPLRLFPTDNEGNSIRAVARLRRRGHRSFLRAAATRGRHDQIYSKQDHWAGY